jgi:hypothetical protein
VVSVVYVRSLATKRGRVVAVERAWRAVSLNNTA